jgi:hypothetical protein
VKTRIDKLRILIFLSGVLLFMPSCSKEWDWFGKDPESDEFEAYIVSFHVPYSLHAGQPAVLTVTYAKPQPCFTRTGIDTHLRAWEMEVEVWLKRDHAYACPDVLVEESAEFSVVFPHPGIYTLKYRGVDGPETLGIEVLQ